MKKITKTNLIDATLIVFIPALIVYILLELNPDSIDSISEVALLFASYLGLATLTWFGIRAITGNETKTKNDKNSKYKYGYSRLRKIRSSTRTNIKK